MRMRIDGSVVTVALSRRNLLVLLAKLDDPLSLRTLIKREDDGLLTVTAEEDQVHYNRPEGGPGPMHPRTELALETKHDA